jgi:hypothetical protein
MFACCLICFFLFHNTVLRTIENIKNNSLSVSEFFNCTGFIGWIHVGVFTSLVGGLILLVLMVVGLFTKSQFFFENWSRYFRRIFLVILCTDFGVEIIGTINKELNGCKSGYPNYLNVFTVSFLVVGAIVFAIVKKNNQ